MNKLSESDVAVRTNEILGLLRGKVQQCRDNVNMASHRLEEGRAVLMAAQDMLHTVERKYPGKRAEEPRND